MRVVKVKRTPKQHGITASKLAPLQHVHAHGKAADKRPLQHPKKARKP
jgi:hypothetical protein